MKEAQGSRATLDSGLVGAHKWKKSQKCWICEVGVGTIKQHLTDANTVSTQADCNVKLVSDHESKS